MTLDSNTVTDNMSGMNQSVEQLAERVTAWCHRFRVVPANGQVATETTVRTLRYYRSTGLLDAPTEGGGLGYSERHFLQAAAVRVLQAQGLPLSRIQSLLFGRSDDELKSVLASAEKGSAPSLPNPDMPPAPAGDWQTYPLGPDFLLIARRAGATLSSEQLSAIQKIIHPVAS